MHLQRGFTDARLVRQGKAEVAKSNTALRQQGRHLSLKGGRRHAAHQHALQPCSSSTLAVDCCCALPLQVERQQTFGGVRPAESQTQYTAKRYKWPKNQRKSALQANSASTKCPNSILPQLNDRPVQILRLGQDRIFQDRLIGNKGVHRRDPLHRGIEVVEELIGDARGDLRAVAPAQHIFMSDDDPAGLAD